MAGEGANEGAGGTPETQRDFLESLSTESASSRRPPDRGRKPPIANQFALGYTYQDVLDTDHEGMRTSYRLTGMAY
jgi:dynein light intermediate chain 1